VSAQIAITKIRIPVDLYPTPHDLKLVQSGDHMVGVVEPYPLPCLGRGDAEAVAVGLA
jgi:hypothetical protein